LPICTILNPEFYYLISGVALELKHIDLQRSLANFYSNVALSKLSYYFSRAHILVTDIMFLVKVPVLSEQILSAPPIV
jgi:hypothetical protein